MSLLPILIGLIGAAGATLWRGLGLVVVCTVVLGMSAVPASAAAEPLLAPTATAALARLHSYQVHLNAMSRGALAATFVQTAIVVRVGGQTQLDLVSATRPLGAGETTIVENVVRGATVCERSAFNAPVPLHGPFACTRAPGEAAALTASIQPIADLLPPGSAFGGAYMRGPMALLRGVRCDAFRYSARATTAQERGTLYFSHAMGVPCEQDATTTGTAIIGLGPAPSPAGRATTTAVTTWSRFNDPTLRIPQAPTA